MFVGLNPLEIYSTDFEQLMSKTVTGGWYLLSDWIFVWEGLKKVWNVLARNFIS